MDDVKNAQPPVEHECGEEHCDHLPDKPGQAKTLKDSVAEALAGSGQRTFEMVKTHLVEEELKKRTDLILKGFAKKDELEREIRKVKPDQESFDVGGKKLTSTYSKAKVDELKKLADQLSKVESALEKALNIDKPCFDKLREIVGK